jgi:hypothetical protein
MLSPAMGGLDKRVRVSRHTCNERSTIVTTVFHPRSNYGIFKLTWQAFHLWAVLVISQGPSKECFLAVCCSVATPGVVVSFFATKTPLLIRLTVLRAAMRGGLAAAPSKASTTAAARFGPRWASRTTASPRVTGRALTTTASTPFCKTSLISSRELGGRSSQASR